MNVLLNVQRARRLTRNAMKAALWQRSLGTITRRLGMKQEPSFVELVANYNVVIMKHCFPSSDVLEDMGKADPTSPRRSLENYKAIYRLLRDKFDKSPDTLFIVWTLPPKHRLFEPSEGSKDENAARATAFSQWLKRDFLSEGGSHPNIYIWDFRDLVVDPNTNFLKYEYESSHESPDSHPNELANNETGPKFAQFILDSIADFTDSKTLQPSARIIFLCHSTGQRLYEYSALGMKAWFARYNASRGTSILVRSCWYPLAGNMPVHYYRSWVIGRSPGSNEAGGENKP
jgi:hypothetical protein